MVSGKVLVVPRIIWSVECVRDGKTVWTEKGKNVVPYEGLNYLINAGLKGGAQETAWYCTLFKNNIVPALSDTAASALGSGGTYGEVTDSDVNPQTNRPEVIFGTVSNGVVDNSDNRVEFTALPASLTVYGAVLTSTQAKLDTSGILLGAKLFSQARTLLQNDILYIVVEFSLTSA